MRSESSKTLDLAGILFSSTCAVHCALVPVIAFLAPSVSTQFEFEWLHVLLLLLIIPIAGFSFYRQTKYHGRKAPLVLGSMGVILLIAAYIAESLQVVEREGVEVMLTVIGSFLLILGHILNMRCLKK